MHRLPPRDPDGSTGPGPHPYLRRRAIAVVTRNWMVLSPGALVLLLLIDALRGPARPWTQLPFAVLGLFHGLGIWCALRDRLGGIESPLPSTRSYGWVIAGCGLFGCLWAATALNLAARPEALLRDFLLPSLIYAGVLIAPLRAGALVYTATIAAGAAIAPTIGLGHQLPWLALFYLVTACILILWQYAEFVRSANNELKLEEQSETIGILLHEFEEQGCDWLWETDCDLRLVRPSEQLQRVTGCSQPMLARLSLRRWLAARHRLATAGREELASLARCLDTRMPFRDICVPIGPSGGVRWLRLTGKPVFDAENGFRGYRGVGSDVTAGRQSEERVRWLARHDSLTGLLNRARFHALLDEACAASAANGKPLALLSLDLDGFKAVNDTLGHPVGDSMLVEVATRLSCCIRDNDLLARLGGDEFALLLVGSDQDGASSLASRLIARIGAPFSIEGRTANIGLSIGIVLSGENPTAPELIKCADLALYRAKAQGRGVACLFDPGMGDHFADRQSLQADLRHALARDELVLQFQPIMSSVSGRAEAAEALIRWRHPVRGLIPPASFVPIAEETGLICPIGLWVLRTACREALRWPAPLSVSVNLSPVQLHDPFLADLVEQTLHETGLAPERLILEITESLLIDNSQMIQDTLSRLQDMGIRIALDDFGTGFCSLAYLRRFKVDIVKIDRSFVQDLGSDRDADMIVRAITGMTAVLGIATTAEGVETDSQAAHLLADGCTHVQGFLYSRPRDADAIVEFFRTMPAAGPDDAAPAPPRHRTANRIARTVAA